MSCSRYDIACINPPIRTSKMRREAAQEVAKYLYVITPEERVMPGFKGKLAKWDRHRHGELRKTLLNVKTNVFSLSRTRL